MLITAVSGVGGRVLMLNPAFRVYGGVKEGQVIQS